MDMFGLLGTLLSTGMSVLSQQAINQQNINLSQDVNQQQIDAANQSATTANQRARQNYFDLYSPQAMTEQYKEAGLSPGLMYQMGGNSGVGSAPIANVGNLNVPTLQPLYKESLGAVSSMLKDQKEIEKKGAEIDEINQSIENLRQQIKESDAKISNLVADTANKEVENKNLKLNNDLLTLQKQFEEAVFDDKVNIMHESLNKVINENEKILKEIDLMEIEKEKKAELIQTQIDKMNAEIDLMAKQQYLVQAQSLTEYAKQILYSSEAKLNNAQRDKIRKEIAKIEAETDNVIQQGSIEWYTLDAYRRGQYYSLQEHGYGKLIGTLQDFARNLDDMVGRQKKDFQNYQGIPYSKPDGYYGRP